MQAVILVVASAVLSVFVLVRRAERLRDAGMPASRWNRWLVRASEAFQYRMLSRRE